MNEQDQFLSGIEQNTQEDAFGQVEVPAEPVDTDDPEQQPESVKDRRHRRLEAKLQAERETNIELSTRLKTISEMKRETDSPDYLKNIERIYGTDSPEATAATDLLKSAFIAATEEAKQKALEEFESRRLSERQQLAQEEKNIDSMLDELEETYGVDLTSPSAQPARTAYLTLLEKMSPKDSTGTVIAYADPHGVWETYQTRITKKPDTRAKDLAARGLTQSGASANSTLQDDANMRFLREHGII